MSADPTAPKPLPVVLVVATDTVTCDVVQTALDGAAGVLAATTFRAARAAAQARPPSIAIVDGDLALDELHVLLEELRSATGRLDVLVIAPRVVASDAPEVVRLGRVLERPVHPGQVAEEVKRLLVAAPEDAVDELLARVHRSQTTRFDR